MFYFNPVEGVRMEHRKCGAGEGSSLYTQDIRINYKEQYPFPPLPATPTWGPRPAENRWYKN